MKYRKAYLALLVLAVSIICIPSIIFAGATDRIEKSYKLDKNAKVVLQNVSGDIVVNSWKDDQVKITAVHTGGPEKDLNEVVHITQTSKDIRITTRASRSLNIFKSNHTSVHYELYVPNSVHFKTETTSGNVELSGLGGAVEVKTVSGSIKIMSAGDNVKCKTISGDIDLKEITGVADLKTTSGDIHVNHLNGSLEAETVSGDVDLNEIHGKVNLRTTSGHLKTVGLTGSLEAESVSGDISIKSLSAIKGIEIETLSGDISVQGILTRDGSYTLGSHSGTIKIKLPEQSDFEIAAKTYSGDIDCGFKLHGSLYIDNKQLKGIVGKDGASINVSTYSGNIRIKKK